MELDEYQRRAMVTQKKYTDKREKEVNALLGLSGEVGEVCDIIKKFYSTGKPYTREDLIKEAGDILWYLAELCEAFDFTLETVAQENLKKLFCRHGNSFSGDGNRTGAGK